MSDNDILDAPDRDEYPHKFIFKSIWHVRFFIFLAAGGIAFWLEFLIGIILDIYRLFF